MEEEGNEDEYNSEQIVAMKTQSSLIMETKQNEKK